ncbi:MAG: NosD domain-containing protein, partial [Candidatus Paceibacterota bacterium]
MKKRFLEWPIHHRIFFVTIALTILSSLTFAGIFYAKKAFTSPAPSSTANFRMPTDPSRMRGETSGTDTHFAIADSEYLNITLDSSETVDLRFTSIPKVITMMFAQATTSVTATQITLSGLVKNTTYYKYEDDYHHLTQFTSDNNGAYSYTQDISTRHFVFIQTVKSTKFISDTGGDCATIGTWNQTAKTCTLNQDISETVQIDSDGVTLDGNGHKITITPEYTVNGIFISGKASTTVKNLTVNGAYEGIFLYQSNSNIIADNTLVGNMNGMHIYSGKGNTIERGIINANHRGIGINSSTKNRILDNTIQENNFLDIDAYGYIGNPAVCDNTITGNIGSGGRPIGFFNSPTTLTGGTFSELILCNADNSNISNVTVRGSDSKQNNGFFAILTDSSTFIDNTSNDNNYGMFIGHASNNNAFERNTANGNIFGIIIYNSINNRVLENTSGENHFDLNMQGGYIGSAVCGNTIAGNIGSGDRPIGFFNATTTLSGGTFSQLIFCNADHSEISNVTVNGSDGKRNNGFLSLYTDHANFSNITSNGNTHGIYLINSQSNTFENTTVTDDGFSIFLDNSNTNILKNISAGSNGNIWFDSANNNELDGATLGAAANVYFHESNSNRIHNFTFSGACNIYTYDNAGTGNLIYNNNSVGQSFRTIGMVGNSFNLPKPIGGNYWSEYDTPEEGCNDADNDGFCDAPYVIPDMYSGGSDSRDNLPWTTKDGWKGKTVKVAVVLAEMSDTFHSTGSFTKQFCDSDGNRVTKTYAGHTREYFQDLTNCVRDYYRENSYGAVNVEFDIFDNNGDWYRTSRPYTDYVSPFPFDLLKNEKRFVRDAYSVSQPLIEGNYDALAMVHAGYSYAKEDESGYLLRSRSWVPSIQPITNPPYALIVGEFEDIGVLTHELGHVLGTILAPEHTSTPDMYKTDYNQVSDSIGAWDLMARGAIGSFKNNPVHMSSYIKEFLGWLQYDHHFDGNYDTFPIDALETKTAGSGVFRYNTDLSKNTYYIAEARDKNLARWDTLLPDNREKALVLYYVDTHNSDTYGYDWLTGNPKYLPCTISIPPNGVLANNSEFYSDYDNLLRFTKSNDSEDLTSIPKKYSVDLNVSHITPNPIFPNFLKGIILRPSGVSPLFGGLNGLFSGTMIPPDGPELSHYEGRLFILLYFIFIFSLLIFLVFFVPFCFIRDEQRRKQMRRRFVFGFVLTEILMALSMTLFWWYLLYVVPTGVLIPQEEPSAINPDTDLHAITPDGRHIGMNYVTGLYENKIAGSIVSGDLDNMHEWIFVPSTETVRYYVSAHDTQAFFDANPDIASQVPDKTDKY